MCPNMNIEGNEGILAGLCPSMNIEGIVAGLCLECVWHLHSCGAEVFILIRSREQRYFVLVKDTTDLQATRQSSRMRIRLVQIIFNIWLCIKVAVDFGMKQNFVWFENQPKIANINCIWMRTSENIVILRRFIFTDLIKKKTRWFWYIIRNKKTI